MLHITIVIPSGLLWYDLTETYGLASTMCLKNWLPYHFNGSALDTKDLVFRDKALEDLGKRFLRLASAE